MVTSGEGAYHGIPYEEIGSVDLFKESENVVEITMDGEGAEGDEPAGGEGFMDEACGYHLSVDLS